MIPNPKFIPGQDIFIVNKHSLSVRQEKIISICWYPSDGIIEGNWQYACDIDIMEDEIMCGNFAEVMEVLNG